MLSRPDRPFPTYKAYADATLEQVLAVFPKPAGKVETTTLASTVFFQSTNHFEAVEMPYAAQIAPAFAVNVGDFDGDGNEDVFLSQNFITLAAGVLRPDDAGRGLWLRAQAAASSKRFRDRNPASGLRRAARAALGDFDGDGRVDLVVSQNGAETKLYQNVLANRPAGAAGGAAGNPDGVGRRCDWCLGPAGSGAGNHGGSGYWSQDSVVQVMGCRNSHPNLVRWPGGKTTTSPSGRRRKSLWTQRPGEHESLIQFQPQVEQSISGGIRWDKFMA